MRFGYKTFWFFWGLQSVAIANAQPQLPPSETRPLKEIYQNIGSDSGISSVEVLRETHSCIVKKVILLGADPISGAPQTATLLQYSPLNAVQRQAQMLIYPSMRFPNRGATAIEKTFSKHFCDQGISSTIIQDWTGYFDITSMDLLSHDQMTKRLFNVSKMTLDYLKSKVFVLGISAGAIYSSMVAGLDDRVLGGVLIVGGASLDQVLSKTKQKSIKAQREQRFLFYGINNEKQYEEKMKESVLISPELATDQSKTPNMLLVMGERDKTVPYQHQFELWEDWGKPQKLTFKSAHMMTIIDSFLFRHKKIEVFLSDRIKASNKFRKLGL